MYSKDEAKAIKIEFWDNFKRYSKRRGRKMTSWVLKGTQIKEAQLKFDINENGAFVMLQIDSKLDIKRHSVFDAFEKYKTIIDEACGSELIWNRDYYVKSFKDVSVIYYHKAEADIFCKDEWESIFKFFFKRMETLELAFLDVKEVVQASV